MKNESEYERRAGAIKLLGEGVGFEEVLRQVQRGRFRFSKWSRRYKAFGMAGLLDRSRASKHVRNKTRERLVGAILALRDELAAHKSRRAAFAGIGAEYFSRRKLDCQYVVSTLSTHHRRVFVKHKGTLIKSIPFPFTGKVIDPLC